MKRIVLYKSIIFFICLLFSCKEKDDSLENRLVKSWSYDVNTGILNIDSNSFLNFFIEIKNGDTLRHFESMMNGRRDIGTWEISDSTRLTLSSPLQNFETGIDSISQSFDKNGDVKINYLKDNEIVTSFTKGEFTTKQFEQIFDINRITKDSLSLILIDNKTSRPIALVPYTNKPNRSSKNN